MAEPTILPSTPIDPDGLPNRIDLLRDEVAALVADRNLWEDRARERQRAAEDLATGLHDLAEEVRRAEAARDEAQTAAAADTAERLAMEERLRRAERARDEARAEAAASARRAAEGQAQAVRLLEESSRLHQLDLAPHRFDDGDTLYENILEASVELAGAEKGVCLRPADPFAILARVGFEEAEADSPLLAAIGRRVAESQEPLVLNDRAEIETLADDRLAVSLRNLVGHQIVTGERLAGVVIVANRREGPFTEEETKLLLGIGSHAAVALENRRLRRDRDAAYAATVGLLCDVIEAKDPYTHGHCEEVAVLALAIARELGLGPDEQHAVFQAGLFHDVGKIAISDGILLKQGPLLAPERQLIETHPVVGADLVRRVPALRHPVPIIRHHHERYDGAGYPDRLTGDAIPLLARILGVADAYEAMRSTRPYRQALSAEGARAELGRGAGTQFDPGAVAALLRALDAPERVTQVRRMVAGGGPVAGAS